LPSDGKIDQNPNRLMKKYAEISPVFDQKLESGLIPAACRRPPLAWAVLRKNLLGTSMPGTIGGTGRRRP
jgi:hypothetical protein